MGLKKRAISKRALDLEHIKIAGYDGDHAKMMRIYASSMIGKSTAEAAFRLGEKIRTRVAGRTTDEVAREYEEAIIGEAPEDTIELLETALVYLMVSKTFDEKEATHA